MNIENYIESQYREIKPFQNYEYIGLYKGFPSNKMQEIFATTHYLFTSNYKRMNERLPTKEYGAHFWAEESRNLLLAINTIRGMQRTLKNTSYAFELDSYYEKVVTLSEEFLSTSGGSEIPPHTDKVQLYYTLPIFISKNSIELGTDENSSRNFVDLKLIGEGSYAKVFSFFDDYYNIKYVLKRAKKELNEKEIERFKQEFEQMANLSSPYIVQVYRYDDDKNEYIMEYMDISLDKFIEKNNQSLSKEDRKGIAYQILKAFRYIHSKGLLHRDISPKNILIKMYEDVKVIKVSDFGLVKVPESDLTTVNTEFKGYFNDPSLITEGFYSYNLLHETYAITRLVYYIMTGKTNTSNIKDENLRKFVNKGLSANHTERYQSVDEIIDGIREL